MTWSCPASRWTSVCLGQSQGYEERHPHAHVGVVGQSTMDVSRLFLPELRVAMLLPQLRAVSAGGTWKQWRWQSCEEAGSASVFRGLPLGGVRKVAWRRVSQLGGDGGRGCGFCQGRGAIANLEKARGGKLDVAIDEVLRQKRLERQELKDQMQSRKSTKALLKAAIATRDKAVIKLEGLQRRFRMQRAKPPRRRERSKSCRRGVWPRSIATGRFLMSHLLHLAPRHCHLSSGRLDLRRRSQRTFESSSRSGTTASRSRPRRQWIHSRRFSASCLQLPHFQRILSRRHPLLRHLQGPRSVRPSLSGHVGYVSYWLCEGGRGPWTYGSTLASRMRFLKVSSHSPGRRKSP